MSRRIALLAGIGVVGLTLTFIGGLVNADVFFRSYLLGYTFWIGLGLGSLGIAFVQFLTGGYWGLVTRRIFEAGAAPLPLMAVLFVPVLLGLPRVYAWARPDAVQVDPVLQHKALYLNVPFFVGRTLLYLIAWVILAYLLRRWSAAHDQRDDPRLFRRLQRLAIVGVIVLGLTVTFAAIDWLMSLDADWYSSMYPPMVAMGDLLLALAFGTFLVTWMRRSAAMGELLTPRIYNDLGSLLLAFVMLWAYMAYFQYLLIWAGNLSDEIPWYLRRTAGGWLPVAVGIAGLGFGVPFWFLLFRSLKRNPSTLATIAGLVVLVRIVDVFWLIQPPFEPGGPVVTWTDLTALVGFGGLWLAIFVWAISARPLLPLHDPRLPGAMEAARATV